MSLSPGKGALSHTKVLFLWKLSKVKLTERWGPWPIRGSTIYHELQLAGREMPWGVKIKQIDEENQLMWRAFCVSGLMLES